MDNIIFLNRAVIDGDSFFLGVWPKKANKTQNLYLFGKEENIANIPLSKDCGTLSQTVQRLKTLLISSKPSMQMFIEDEKRNWYKDCIDILSEIKEW